MGDAFFAPPSFTSRYPCFPAAYLSFHSSRRIDGSHVNRYQEMNSTAKLSLQNTLKTRFWPLGFARLYYCFGLHDSEASIVQPVRAKLSNTSKSAWSDTALWLYLKQLEMENSGSTSALSEESIEVNASLNAYGSYVAEREATSSGAIEVWYNVRNAITLPYTLLLFTKADRVVWSLK